MMCAYNFHSTLKITVILFGSIALLAKESMMASPETRKQWREDILSGVHSIPRTGWPGTVVVFGENAEPILTSGPTRDVVVAVAELGEGRLIVFTHDAYTNDWFLKREIPENALTFTDNILSWLTRGKYTKDWNLVKINETSVKEANPSDTVLVWQGPKPQDDDLVEDITRFVKGGGGSVIIGVTPWGAMDLHDISLNDISCYEFLREVQIYLTSRYSDFSGEVINLAQNNAASVHIGHRLDLLKTGKIQIADLSPDITDEIASIPDDDCSKILKEHLTIDNVKSISKIPDPKSPITKSEDIAAVVFVNFLLKKSGMAAPGLTEFPGDFPEPPPTSFIEYQIESTCKEPHPVGAYLPAGGTAVIEVVSGNPSGWRVQVGCHTDNLESSDKLLRWPDIVVNKKLENKETTIRSPFGGSIYLFGPTGSSYLFIRIKGDVVASPLFRLSDTREDWYRNRIKPGLWADFVGKHTLITVPSNSIRDKDYPFNAMQFWDEVIMSQHELKGTDLTNRRRQWFVPDIQPSVGYMHSGNPIVTEMDAADPEDPMFLINKPSSVGDGHWGYFHEHGHNMQDAAWTFKGTGQVTCNIFALYTMLKLFDIQPWENFWLEGKKDNMRNYLKNGADFEEWKNSAGVALGIYAQIARDFGFGVYKTVFRKYSQEKPNLYSDQEKIDYWVKSMSRLAKSNLIPAFKMWGIPVSESVATELVGLPEYTPMDDVTVVLMPWYSWYQNIPVS